MGRKIDIESFNKEFLQIAEEFSRITGLERNKMSRDFYRARSKHKNDYAVLYSDFQTALKSILSEETPEEKKFKRDDIEKTVTFNRKKVRKKYFVSAVIAGSSVNRAFMDSIKAFLEEEKASLVLLPMRGVNSADEYFSPEALELAEYFVTEFHFNSNLRAFDMKINPQQRDPLTGFDSLGHKGYSCIFASPKQFMRTIPSPVSRKYPHVLYSTGTISTVEYRNTRIGKLAMQDHTYGGLIVDVLDGNFFDIRVVQADSDGCFYDINKKYTPKGVESVDRILAFVMGDYHCGFEDHVIVRRWKELIRLTKPEHVIFHDFFDGCSISHHNEGKYITKSLVPERLNTLQKELDYMVTVLDLWSTEFPDITFNIVRSNHDEFLDRYLDEGRYITERHNHRLSLELALALLDGKNPLEYYYNTRSRSEVKNTRWLKMDEDLTIGGFQLGSHGHVGSNGSRGSKYSFERAYGRSITGHVHSPGIFRNTIQVGCTCYRTLSYTKGPSSWLNCSALVFPNNTFTLIVEIPESDERKKVS